MQLAIIKEKNEGKTNCDQWMKLWLERKNQQVQSSGGVLQIRFFEKLQKIRC